MGTVIMETAHTGKCATPLASMNSVYAYAGPTGVFRGVERRTSGRTAPTPATALRSIRVVRSGGGHDP
jgi:hypothetical protein